MPSRPIFAIARRRPQLSIATLIFILLAFSLLYRSIPRPQEAPASIPTDYKLTGIPKKIWQSYFGFTDVGDQINLMNTWISRNPDYQYTFLRNEAAYSFARKYYQDRPHILKTFLDLKLPVYQSDLVSYMILEAEGGIYSDVDTDNLRGVDEWVPAELKSQVRAIIGVEYDQRNDETYTGMSLPIQFCHWTFAATPGHMIVKHSVVKVVQALNDAAERNHTTVADLTLPDSEVVKVSGPVVMTEAILEVISNVTSTEVGSANLTGMTEPKLIDDIYVLPINYFGAGQPHSGSWVSGGNPPEAVVRHLWQGSWKHNWNG